jgi:hypothetical protein
MKKKQPILILLMLVLFSSTLFAQVTTSGITGIVVNESNEALPGATIVAVHQPSGTQYGTITNSDGRFTLQNMRIGGPYKVTISFVSYVTKVYTDINLSLGNMTDIKVKLDVNLSELGEAIISFSHGAAFNSEHTGANTNISKDIMQTIPTISRGLRDFTKISPLANTSGSGTSFAGSNNRYNQFAIDGLVNNDVFGLSASGTNGGQTGIEPISLDAIEEFQINIAPYDIRQGGFSGGGINAVTKSGSNTISGSAYFYGNNQSFVGNYDPTTQKKADYPKYNDYQAGFTLGGSIIKNKLFFFINGEIGRKKVPLAYEPGTDASKISKDEVERVLAVLKRVAPSYDAGSYTSIDNETNSNKFLVKLNWNISNKHKLVLRHSYTYGENFDNSRNETALRFYNNGIYFPSTTNSSGLELSSIINSTISNKLLIGYTRVHDDREPMGNAFPTVLVNIGSGRTVTLGSEYSSVANLLNQDIFTLNNDLNIYQGKHTITVGTHNEFYTFYNLFVQNIYGNYAYSSLADFESIGTNTEVSPTYYSIGYSFDNTDNPSQSKGAAKFSAIQLGFYAQDEYQLTNDLKITGGLRLDIPVFTDKPEGNTAFNTDSVYISQGVETGQLPASKLLLAPRLGFNWDVFGDKTFQVRGGTGVFTGRVPFVWVSNQFSNNGQLNGSYSTGSTSSSATPISNPVGLKFNADPYKQPLAEDLGKVAGRGAINVIDKNFKFPQVFRSNLAFDKTLPGGIVATVEGIFSKTFNNINFVNLNRKAQSKFAFAGADQRPIYTTGSTDPLNKNYVSAARINPNFEEIIKLENTNKGYSYNIVLQLQKDFENGFNSMVAYTYGHSEDLNSGTSSVAYSNWRYVNNVYGLNNLKLTTSNFDLGSRIVGFISYQKKYLNELMSTQVSLFYNGQSGQPLSYIYNGDMNYDAASNDLIYIPKQMSDINLISATYKDAAGTSITLTPQEQWDKLNAFIEKDSYLKKHRGEYAERNGARLPFQHQFDIRILQEFKVKTGDISNRLQLSIDIINVGNLLNNKWGRSYFDLNQQFSLIDYKGLANSAVSPAVDYSTNTPTFTYTGNNLVNGKPYSVSDLSSRWRAQIGIRYIF